MHLIQISELTIRIVFLFIPGIISVLIIDTLTTHRKREVFFFLVHAFLLGTISYASISLIVWLNNKIVLIRGQTPSWKTAFIEGLINEGDLESKVYSSEIFFSSLLSVVIALIIVVIINRKFYYKFFNFVGITSKHGDSDVWDFLFSSNEVEWISIRDKVNGLIYQGSIRAFSEKDQKKELHLSDVIVYDEVNDKKLYCMDYMYFNFNINSNIFIDIYRSKESEDNEQKEEAN